MGLYTSIASNRAKTVFLVVLFPVFLLLVVYLIAFIVFAQDGNASAARTQAHTLVLQAAQRLIPIILIRWLVSFLFHRQLIFSFSGAKPLERNNNPKIYNLVENLCISRGIPTPKIGILHDSSMNAFAVGRAPKNARIVFSQGLLDRLDDHEIEAVAAHELTHILNRDSLLMIIIVVFIGIIATLGEILVRVRFWGNNNKQQGLGTYLVLVGIAFLIIGYLVYPLIRLAISRKREFLADAGSVELTKNPEAMISALQKISWDPAIESIQKDTIAAMCIANPFPQGIARFKHLWSTHPPIEARIQALQGY